MLLPHKKENTWEESSRRGHAGRWIKPVTYHIGARSKALKSKPFHEKTD